MEARLVTAQCHTSDFPSVEAALREWPEVEAVGSFREKSNNKKDLTTVFVTFSDEETAKAAGEKLGSIKELIMDSKENGEKKSQGSSAVKSRNKNLAAEFMKYDTFKERKHTERTNNRGRESGRGGRGGKQRNTNNGENENGEQTSQSRGRGRGRGRGGRGGRGGRAGQGGSQQPQQRQPPQQDDMQQMRGGRGRGRHPQFQRLPPIEANAAFADNIPFGTTNDHLMELFAPYGRVLDINRLELMAMVCYDNPESVQQCIQHLNGTKVGQNYITVSSGVVRIPGNVAAYLGM